MAVSLRMDRAFIAVSRRERVEPRARPAVVRLDLLEVLGVPRRGQVRHQCLDRVLDGADEPDVDGDAAADVLAAEVNLHHLRAVGVERPVGEVGAEHEQGVAVLHRAITGREPEQPGHADVVGVVVLDELLAPQRVDDGCLKRAGHRDNLVVCALAAGAGEDRDALGGVQNVGRGHEFLVAGADHRRGWPDHGRANAVPGVVEEDLAGDDHHRDAAALDREAHRDLEHPRHLLRHADELRVHAALAEQLLGVRFLEVAPTDLRARDVRRDREHRHPAAVRVEQSVDQMQVPRAATRGAHREPAGHRRLAGGSERRPFLVTNVLPGHRAVTAKGVGEPVDRISRQPVHPAYAGRLEGRHYEICDCG